MPRAFLVPILGVTLLACLPALAGAQQSSAIAGAVRDTSGALLPGVTAEAASPALIEKVRVAVTDSEGRYNIADLRPGQYTITFTLPGFATFRREGIVLTAGFTATVNADLQVGALEETIVVTGESPLVDTQNVRRQTVVSQEMLETLPTSTKNANSVVALTLGLAGIADVAGIYATQIGTGTYHGKGGARTQLDGMSVQNMTGNTGYQLNTALVQEMTLQSSGISAEGNAEGILMNMIPKEGGNTFSGSLSGLYTNDRLAGNNLTDELRSRGLDTVNEPLKIYDASFALGGPIKRDRVWFFTAHREWGNAHQMAGFFWNKTQGTPVYTPDRDRPATRNQWFESHAARVTWQATQKHKFNFFADVQDACICRTGTTVAGSGVGLAPEGTLAYHFRPTGFFQGSWSAPLTSKLLIDASFAATINHWPQFRSPGVEPHHISILEQSTGVRYNARETYDDPNVQDRYAERFSVSYVTGSHAMKFGVQDEQGILKAFRQSSTGNVSYTFNNGLPISLTQYATPYELQNRFKHDMGIYAQDQWAINRLTLNLGVRFDYFYGYVPAQHVPATPNGWLPERNYPQIDGVPSWTDLSPRVGAAYDLFGDGRTALKLSVGRYVSKTVVEIANANNPIVASVNQVARSWTDANGNFIPDCDLASRAGNGECGPLQNQNFGSPVVTTRFSDDVLKGFGVRPYNWDIGAEVQRQFGPSISATAGYYRNWYGNFRVTDNLAVTPDDYAAYCVTSPGDARLPGGGGHQICGLYDVDPTKFGQVNNLVRPAKDFGTQTQSSNFFTFAVEARLAPGVRFGGGIDTGRTLTDVCFNVDSPGAVAVGGVTSLPGISTAPVPHTATTIDGEKTCRVTTPFSANTQVKLNGSYAFPGEVFVSAVYQNLPGAVTLADYAAPTASIASSLGRQLAGGARTATVPLLSPQTEFEARTTRLDLRVAKTVRVGQRVRIQGNVDLYNALNSGSVLALTNVYGARWLVPTLVLEPRILQFSAQVNF
jgi:hypothetical protein